MKDDFKFKMYPRDIIFVLVSLLLLAYSVISYVTEPSTMGFANSMIKGFAYLCLFGGILGITAIHSDDDVRLNLYVTQFVSSALWWLSTLITYIIVEVAPMMQMTSDVGEVFAAIFSMIFGMFMITMMFLVLILTEVIIVGIISLESRNRL